MSNWLDYMEEEAAKRRAEAEAQDNDPAYQERMKRKKQEEFERGVRLGWWDENGDPIPQAEEDDEPDADEDEGE